MNIAFFTDTYHPSLNGVTTSVDNFTEELRKKGHTVYIFAPKIRGYKETRPNVFRIVSFKVLSAEPDIRIPIPINARYLKEVTRKNFDIVHAHGNGFFSILGYQVAAAKGVPFVMTFHTLHTKYTHYFFKGKIIKPRMVAAAMKIIVNLCDGVITPSEKMKRELISYGVKKDILVVPNFVQIDNFHNIKKGFLHEKLKLSPSSTIVLSVGRLGIEKNFEFLIRTFQKVVEKNSNSHFVIVGEGMEKKKLLYLSKKLKIEKNVHLIGAIPSELMPQIYADADIFIFASKTETQGICVLEAAASSLPLILTRDSAFTSSVREGENGYLLPLSQKVFADKILMVLSDSIVKEKMGSESRKIAERTFRGGDVTDALLRVYNTVLSNYGEAGKMRQRVNKEAVTRFIQAKNTFYKIFS